MPDHSFHLPYVYTDTHLNYTGFHEQYDYSHYVDYRGRRSGKAVRLRELNQRKTISSRVTYRDLVSKFTFNSQVTRTVDFENLIQIDILNSTSTSPKLHFGVWNAQSIRGKTASLCDLVHSNKLDILAITESWLNGNSNDNHIIADIKQTLLGYNFVSTPRTGRRGGGIAVLLREELTVKQNDLFNFVSMEYSDLALTCGRTTLRLVVIYRPPSSNKNKICPSVFIHEFSTLLELLTTTSGHLLITGDFNLHIDSSSDMYATRFLDVLHASNLRQHIAESTHRKGHTLDLIITRNEEDFVSNIQYHRDLPSDHDAVQVLLDTPCPKPTKKLVNFRRIDKINLDSFKSDLVSSTLFKNTPTDLELLVNEYQTILADLIDKHAPMKSHIITCRPNAPWFSDDLHALKIKKRRYERKWRSSGLEVDRQIFKKQCKQYTQLLNNVKTEHVRCQVRNANQKQLFQFVDKLSNVKTANIFPSHDCKRALSEDFSDYLQEKIRIMLDTNLDKPSQPVPVDSTKCHSNLCHFTPLSLENLKRIVMKSPTKSCLLDQIPTWLLKNCFDVIGPVILKIINMSMENGTVPTCFKTALVRPVLKKAKLDPELYSNYRPISNLSFISKVLERAVCEQLTTYLDNNSLFAKMQSAYRKNHSVETALVRVYNDMLLALDNKKEIVLILLDLSAAFDTINHNFLLSRLSQRYGLSGSLLSWLKSYIGRSQAVIIDNETSTPRPITCGIPQGSVLGPILFILYIAPIEDIITAHNLLSMFYADDSQIYLTFKQTELTQAVSRIEMCISELKTWLTTNHLLLNDSKTEIIHITSRFGPTSEVLPPLQIGTSFITSSPQARDLGLIVDSHLNMQAHISQLCQSSSHAIRLIGQLRKFLTRKQTESLVHAYVTSRLDNNNSLFYSLPDHLTDKLQYIQNTAARLVTLKRKCEHITPVLYALHWLPIKQRIIFKILLLTFKALRGKSPAYISELLNKYNPVRALRSSGKQLLTVPRQKTTTYGNRAFAVSAPKLWNSISPHLREANCTIDIFKTELKTYLFRQHFN